MQFDEALRYLLSLGNETLAIKLGLANITQLLCELGSPHKAFPIVQIAGTNGKGSTAAMLDSICKASHIRSGLYTSPHLLSMTERIRIAGKEISEPDFAEIASQVRDASERVRQRTGTLATFFEQTTAIALLAFREMKIELAILETGLGGRLDATTAARAGIVAITPIALDHQEYLGNTLAEIAAEKAAVIRRGVRGAVVSPQQPEAMKVIEERCEMCGVIPIIAGEKGIISKAIDGRLRISFTTRGDVYENVSLSLRGRHQVTNAVTSVCVAELLRKEGFRISRASIIEGLECAEHAGRLEMRSGEPSLLFDGAHNPASATALRDYLAEFVNVPLTLVFGAMRDKDLREMAEILFPLAAQLILTAPEHVRAASPETIAAAAPNDLDNGRIHLVHSVSDALQKAYEQTPPHGVDMHHGITLSCR